MRKKIIAGNWKMNLVWGEALRLTERVMSETSPLAEVVLAVPFVYLQGLQEKIHGSPLKLAAQDCSAHASGAYTGEVSAAMLASLGIHHCIIGHSERRLYHGESDAILASKSDRLLEHDIHPVFCIGERLEQRKANEHMKTVAAQLERGLFHLDASSLSRCILAYEPVWAIGTGVTATPPQAQEMHAEIRRQLAAKYSDSIASTIRILYGGSVTASNAGDLFGCPDVDGGLVGGASLKPAEFASIIQAGNKST